jgi:hypothetical protein
MAIEALFAALWDDEEDLDVVTLAFADGSSSRRVQDALEHARPLERRRLVEQLRGNVQHALQSPHANYVVKAAVELSPIDDLEFLLLEVERCVNSLAMNQYACRTLISLVKHFGTHSALVPILEALDEAAPRLMLHRYGHFVVDALIEHGLPEHRHNVASYIESRVMRHARHRCASYTVQTVLLHCTGAEHSSIAAQLVEHAGELVSTYEGSHVLLTLRDVALLHEDHELAARLTKVLLDACDDGRRMPRKLCLSLPGLHASPEIAVSGFTSVECAAPDACGALESLDKLARRRRRIKCA